jgi:hypothetical protein
MPLPTVTMQPPAGSVIPTIVHLRDGTTVTPDASGQITIASNYISDMLAAGWSIVVSGGTTHVP